MYLINLVEWWNSNAGVRKRRILIRNRKSKKRVSRIASKKWEFIKLFNYLK